jgi:hypothetical protein
MSLSLAQLHLLETYAEKQDVAPMHLMEVGVSLTLWTPYTCGHSGLGLEEVADRNFVWIYGHRHIIGETEQSCGFLQNKGLLERNVLKFGINI